MGQKIRWESKKQEDTGLLARLQRPEKPVDVVIDTDTYNEIDDQYALSYLICSSEKLRLQAIYAAPFFNEKSTGPADGMEKSYQEILNILTLMGRDDLKKCVYKGSTAYLPDEETAVESDAAADLAERAMNYTEENPLYVLAIGAITNVASAILKNPAIIDRIVIVWLGGNAMHWPENKEFNLYQDVAAARVIFGCGAALVQLPCAGVVSEFATTGPELEAHLKGKNRLCDYLVNTTETEGRRWSRELAWSRVIWDVTTVGWLLDGRFMEDYLTPAPIPESDGHYSFDPRRHLMRYVYHINRDALFSDLFAKLAAFDCGEGREND